MLIPKNCLSIPGFLLLMAICKPAYAQTISLVDFEEFSSGESIQQFFERPRQSDGTLFTWCDPCCDNGGPDLDAPLVTDRPDFTEAASTVGRGVAQLEFGYTHTRDDSAAGETESHSVGEPLLRYGIIADWLELRVATNYTTQRMGGVTTDGMEDLYLGFKIGLTPQCGLLPEMALIPQMTVPTGSTDLRANDVLPGANLNYAWEISDRLATGGSTQFNRTVDDVTGTNYIEWAQSWTFAASITEQVGAFTEWYAFIPDSADTAATEHYLNGGFTFLFSDDVQWDIRIGKGLNGPADDYFVGTGFSVRVK